MSTDFRDLVVWQQATDLADRVYDVADRLPASGKFVLSEQMKGAALSVPANIAEGKGRWSAREYRQFLRQARGSAYELQSHILFTERRRLITAETGHDLIAQADEVLRKINALINYLNRRARQPPRPVTRDR